jgi:hypothetical protein
VPGFQRIEPGSVKQDRSKAMLRLDFAAVLHTLSAPQSKNRTSTEVYVRRSGINTGEGRAPRARCS